jgi:hypothetical protein
MSALVGPLLLGLLGAQSAASEDAAVVSSAADSIPELGEYARPIPLSRREPTLSSGTLEVDLHYGLVGSGPTQLTSDLRFAPFECWEIHTSFAPYPAALMTRFKLGKHRSSLGTLVLGGGLAHFDAGVRVFPVEGEPPVGLRAHTELGLGYSRAIADHFAVHGALRWRHRISALSDDEQSAILGATQLSYDVMPDLGVSVGLGYARVVAGEVRELAIQFSEPGRPGMSTFLVRQDGHLESLTLPLSLTYGLVDRFDVDVFATPRLYPQFDVVFGAGLRLRMFDLGSSLGRLFGSADSGSQKVRIDEEN